ncbi:DUF6366 family protein [Thalassobacillus sp. CUG 92003]|uniref:DUF6366 family protein n=1 Tax=Thalassobacillus sp. CUG 92003 TaxID=2736641 RepID=UPI0015E77232|nr:DUF6366 family protein [Thalassobacillus sp. CUG 92003]
MSKDNSTIEGRMKNQRQIRERQKQYNILTSLGWKSAGMLLLVLIIAIVVYAVFFR